MPIAHVGGAPSPQYGQPAAGEVRGPTEAERVETELRTRFPLLLGLPALAIGMLILGLAYISLPHGTIGSVIPVVVFVMGLFLIGASVWAARLGQAFESTVFAMLSAFGLSVAALLLGIAHNWYAIPGHNVASAVEMFFLAWSCLFFFLTFPSFRLSVGLGGIMTFITVFSVLITAGYFEGASSGLLMAGGSSALLVALLCFFGWLRQAMPAADLTGLLGFRVHLSLSRDTSHVSHAA